MIVVALAAGCALITGPSQAADDQYTALAGEILEATGVKGGLVVHLGCGDGRLTAALHANDRYLVHGLDADGKNVDSARRHIRSLGLYGKASVQQLRGRRLPYGENMVNLLVAEGRMGVAPSEMQRVLVPDGVAYIKRGGKWSKTVKARPENIDEWTHFLHDASGNAVAQDEVVGPPRRLQWVTGPVWSRHHNTVASVSAMVSSGGRIFFIADEAPAGLDGSVPDKWSLVAQDAFNGLPLWKRPMPEWGWDQWSADWHGRFNQPTLLPKRLVAIGDTVYVTLGFHAPLTALDAATGETIRTYEETAYTDEIVYQDGLLVLALNDDNVKPQGKDEPPVGKGVCVVEADTGKVLWKKSGLLGIHSKADTGARFGRLELTVGDGQIFLVDRDSVISLDLKSGDELWRAPRVPEPEYVALFGMRMNDLCVLVYHDGLVLFAQPEMEIRDPWHSIPGTLYARSADTGKLLWKHRYGGWAHFYQPDVFVIDDLVWVHEHVEVLEGPSEDLKKHEFARSQDTFDYAVVGLDPATGEVKRRFSTKETFTVGHHHRCYRNKATERFLVTSRRGAEFLDLETEENHLHHWARGGCELGMMPCNGLLYLTPHPCECYITAKLNGIYALAPDPEGRLATLGRRARHPLEKGPAYERQAATRDVDDDDWPTYRHGPSRNGSTTCSVPAEVKPLWQVEIGGKLSAPVVAGGMLFVAAIDEHTVTALDAARGTERWTFTAGGRVDTPPTIHEGLALFGSRDGWVYCVDAATGDLVWRRRAAPADRLVGAYGQLESAWPVRGSILVKNGLAYLAPKTDTMPPADARTMPGALADILVSGGSAIYMRQMPVLGSEAGRQPHLLSTAGFTDDSWFNRTGWAVGAISRAQLLVFDDESAFGVRAYAGRGKQGLFQPGAQGYQLFAGPIARGRGGGAQANRETRRGQPVTARQWSQRVAVRSEAMVLAGETLFVAGTPDVVDPADPLGALEGRKGGLLCAFGATDGEKLTERQLDARPVYDGMAAARGRLYLCTKDGKILCFAGA